MKDLTYKKLEELAKNNHITCFQKGKILQEELEENEFLDLTGSMLERLYGWPS